MRFESYANLEDETSNSRRVMVVISGVNSAQVLLRPRFCGASSASFCQPGPRIILGSFYRVKHDVGARKETAQAGNMSTQIVSYPQIIKGQRAHGVKVI